MLALLCTAEADGDVTHFTDIGLKLVLVLEKCKL